jgi:hypothetical protein
MAFVGVPEGEPCFPSLATSEANAREAREAREGMALASGATSALASFHEHASQHEEGMRFWAAVNRAVRTSSLRPRP